MYISHPGNREKFIEQCGGEQNYLGAYSALSFATFLPMTALYIRSRRRNPPKHVVPVQLMLSMLFTYSGAAIMASGIGSKPAMEPMGEKGEIKSEKRAYGIQRVTRHPMFSGLGLIGLGQVFTAASPAQIAFWAPFPIFYVIGCMHQDYRTEQYPKLKKYMSETSLLPFVAIQQGRNKLVTSEIPEQSVAISAGVVTALYLIRFFPR